MFKRILAADPADNAVLEAAEAVAGRLTAASVESLPRNAGSGEPLDELLRQTLAREADLLVLGPQRNELAKRVAMLSPASVLLLPQSQRLSFDRIVVPVDFSHSSAHALRCAHGLLDSGTLIALSVECDDDPWLDWESDHGRVQRQLNEFVAANGIADAECRVAPLSRDSVLNHIQGAGIAATILAEAQKIDASLIVMGTRGRTTSAALLLGSVTEQVMQRAGVPVLALKEPGGPMGLAAALMARLAEPSPVLATS